MGYKYYDGEEKRLQRKLIPLNIFVAVLALVAAISLMVTPFITIDLGAAMSAATEMMPSEGDSSEGGENGGDVQSDEMMKLMTEGLDVKISVSPLNLAKIAFAEQDKKGEMVLDSIFFDSGLIQTIMTTSVNLAIVSTAELADSAGIDYGELNEALTKFDNAKSEQEFKSAVNEYIGKLESQTDTTLDPAVKEELDDMCSEMYTATVDALDGDTSKFSLEAMICVFVSTGMDENSADKVAITNYKDLVNGIMDGTVSMPGSDGESGDNEAVNTMKDAMATIDDYVGYLGYGFYVMLFFAGIWFILFLFAFFHMFAKNKRFTMWYAKLFGAYPCLIFGVAFKIAGLVMPAMMGEAGAAAVAMLGCISTMTWISGACYLLMWIVSIFWAFPIKRKIRKLRG